MIKLICSAYRKQYDGSTNAIATANLIRFLSRLMSRSYKMQLVVGSYEAAGEISVEVTGLPNFTLAIELARQVIAEFQQECCVVVDSEGYGVCVMQHTARQLGKMEFSVNKPATSGWTHYLNGTYLYAPHQAAVQDAKAA